MKLFLPLLLVLLLLLVGLTACRSTSHATTEFANQHHGPSSVLVASHHSFQATVIRLESAIAARPLRVFARIDHAQGAQAAGLQLSPATLFLFGNPKVGTPLMQADIRFALDLPLRVLVSESANGVSVTYPDMSLIATNNGIDPSHPSLAKISSVLAAIADEATRL